MSSTAPIAEWLEGYADKWGVAGSIPAEALTMILNFSLSSCWLQLGEDNTNEIKHDIHPE